jgi:uncharacterized protein with GYD domain
LEAFYYAFGDEDVFATFDFPDNVSAMAVSMAINRSGGATVKTTVLLTSEKLIKLLSKLFLFESKALFNSKAEHTR